MQIREAYLIDKMAVSLTIISSRYVYTVDQFFCRLLFPRLCHDVIRNSHAVAAHLHRNHYLSEGSPISSATLERRLSLPEMILLFFFSLCSTFPAKDFFG